MADSKPKFICERKIRHRLIKKAKMRAKKYDTIQYKQENEANL